MPPKFLAATARDFFPAGAPLMSGSLPLTIAKVSHVGSDILVEAYPEGECLQV